MKEVIIEEYKCANCKNTFKSGWSHEEAMKESKDLFGEIPKSEMAVVCDDCFKQMLAWKHPHDFMKKWRERNE